MKPVTEDSVNYIDLTNNGPVAGRNPHAEYIEFWNEFLRKYKDILQTPDGIQLWVSLIPIIIILLFVEKIL